MKRIVIEKHALLRIAERSIIFGLSEEEITKRVFQTVQNRKHSVRKHHSWKHKTYYHYFHDNLSLYVICSESEHKIVVKTVIIEEGRQ